MTSDLGATATSTIWRRSPGRQRWRDSAACSFRSTLQGEDSWIVSAALAREIPSLDIRHRIPSDLRHAGVRRQDVGHIPALLGREAGLETGGGGRSGQWSGASAITSKGADRIARAGEFLEVATGIWGQEGFTFKGRFFEVEEGGLRHPLSRYRRPPVTLSGATPRRWPSRPSTATSTSGSRPGPTSWSNTSVNWIAWPRLRGGTSGTASSWPWWLGRQQREAWDEVRRLWLQAGAGNRKSSTGSCWHRNSGQGFRLIGQHAPPLASWAATSRWLPTCAACMKPGSRCSTSAPARRLEEAYRFGEHVVPLLVAESRPAVCKRCSPADLKSP